MTPPTRDGFRVVRVHSSSRRAATSGCGAPSTASRSCPMTRRASRWTATRPTTSRSPGSSSGCAPSAAATRRGMPKIVIGVSAGPRLHPRAHRRGQGDATGSACRAPHILGFTMPGFATSAGTKSNAIHLMESLGITWEELDIRPAATQMLTRPRPPVRARRGGLRRHLRERPGRPAHRLPLPGGQPARRHRARHRRPVRARARLVHLRRRRPDVALRRQHRGAEDVDAAPDPLGRLVGAVRRCGQRRPSLEILDQEISPELVPTKEGERIQSTEDSVGPYALQDFTLFHVAAPRLPPEQDRLPRRGTRGPTPTRSGLARRLPRGRAPGIRPRRRSGTGWRSSSGASSPTSSSARRCPTGRRSSPAARCPRAATGGCRPTPADAPGSPSSSANVPKS